MERDRLPLPEPTKTGRGMLIAGAVLGTAGGIIKIGTTISAVRAVNDERHPGLTLIGGGYFYNPLLGTAIGLVGGAMARRGALDAYRDLKEGNGRSPKVRPGLGWGLFGGGIGLWGITRIAGAAGCGANEACVAAVWELGYYASLAATVPGVIIGGYSTGYRRYSRKFGHLALQSVAPIASRDTWGLAVSGRF